MSKKLGLPLEYKVLPEYFDAWNIQDDTEQKNSVIEKLLKRHRVQSVLDLTCGTGSQVFFMVERGYKCVGADFSPALLKIARSKAKSKKMNIQFIDGDMRTLKVGTFDAVITMFNAIGHLTKSGFEKALRNIHCNLKTDGIYIFDILNLAAMTDAAVAGLACNVHKEVNGTQILATQCSTLNRSVGILTSYDNVMLQKNIRRPVFYNSKFSLQIYTARQLQNMLTRNGFETLGQYAMDGKKLVKNKSISILTVAKKR